jgi:hypothetical protein
MANPSGIDLATREAKAGSIKSAFLLLYLLSNRAPFLLAFSNSPQIQRRFREVPAKGSYATISQLKK